MKTLLTLISIILLSQIVSKFSIAVHGGGGSWTKNEVNPETEAKVKAGILDSLRAGYQILKKKGTHLDAVESAVMSLENNPLFNAGKGAKINLNLEVELDSSIMDGSTLRCGAVAAVKKIKNPIKGARLVMDTTENIMLSGEGADNYAMNSKKLEIVDNSYFFTIERVVEFMERRKTKKIGTVGAVALDSFGNLAAATSTGGFNNKMQGRIGDSPIIGAGNYANSNTVAISCTGRGEEMMRRVLAHDVHARMKYKGIGLREALDEVFEEIDNDVGGLIAVDSEGNVEMPFNTEGMARGYVRDDGKAYVYIFGEGIDHTPIEYDLN
jgi:beta-aspartyl-peptidase (threonine type)